MGWIETNDHNKYKEINFINKILYIYYEVNPQITVSKFIQKTSSGLRKFCDL